MKMDVNKEHSTATHSRKLFIACSLHQRCHLMKKCLFISIVLFIYCYLCVSSSHAKWTKDVSEGSEYTCEELRHQRVELLTVFGYCLNAFHNHDLPVFLLYGSLWGVLRGFDGPLPWDYDIDIGVELAEYSVEKITSIAKELKTFNISMDLETTQSGLIKIKDDIKDRIDLFIYKPSWFNRAWRIGWEPYLLLVHYIYYHSFPFKLIANSRELQQVRFGPGIVRIPRDGLEIMKYLYRDNWNVEKIPKNYNC